MNAFPQQATPDRLFYRGLGYGLIGASMIWALIVLIYFVV